MDARRVDMSYRNCPPLFLPPGVRPGENLRRGDMSIRHHERIQETLPPSDEEALESLEYASRMTLVRIPDTRFIRYRPSAQGLGRWDGRNDIFRCLVLCENCNASECNKRMWYQLDNYESHLCETCLRDHKARSMRR